ncbi:protein transporter HofB [Gallibacterium salpingitidis]|uniref:Protein transporter HofB n=1 Tax=Gallibacterium salpingitidis TaxID=505341 RepID=A0AB36DZD5_9PAST|nr:GspE/PulE family protein [Gallibacterium salpingitidis]OBX06554.1 protein transporter HofB [Gallibacterium salpingitidis]
MTYQVTTIDQQHTFTISEQQWEKNQAQYELLLRYLAVPLLEDEQQLWLAVESLDNLAACEAFAFLNGKPVEPVIIGQYALKQLLQSMREVTDLSYLHEATFQHYSTPTEQPTEEITAADPNEPLIQLFNQLLEQGLQSKASDIHLEPLHKSFQIRFRIDGVLQKQETLMPQIGQRLNARLKLLARLDINELRLPQDGRFRYQTTFGETLDIRLSSLPTQYGEKIVLRLQHNTPVFTDFTKLGMTAQQAAQFNHALAQPQGLILVTGPTGSGKSLTLYSGLHHLNQESRHIVTAEDPIELQLDGIIQTQVNHTIGLNFATLLRSFLRQDPDIIMVGEIRDQETAEIALRAAQTGHLVLSTLHTNTALGAISRLQQLGISQHELENSLLLVIAQRLVRKRCQRCLTPSSDCACIDGYQGRTGIFQLLHYQQQQFTTDYPTLFAAAQTKLQQQITTTAELERVLGKEELQDG